ncbi:protein PLASTID MOVEMENT IMPAIRED 1-like [Andrographis paniculata]|uniref:protein PLASTID MOVEMENT IMPAIRED 1-like n=1 Tax=Andrographis paniculata TaxID=175694 RepID=UPI0021E6F494|nr:protein PLASTID MOVEMENT IMPAIRED 1-like [Andrographis paniculata]
MADAKSNKQILRELESLSESLFHQRSRSTRRRTASFALPRIEALPIHQNNDDGDGDDEPKPRQRRMSMSMSISPWQSKQKENERINSCADDDDDHSEIASAKRSGIWKWKPIRALAHLGKQKLSCLFSVQVVTVKSLPPSMNGLRLAVCVKKKDTRDGSAQTMPSRVSPQGAVDFEETLFVRCHVYFTPSTGLHMKFEPRPFQIYVFAVDSTEELDFGRNSVDLSSLIQESIERSFNGEPIRKWDRTFRLSGKAKGGELVVKLGFQIMEKDGGIGIYSSSVARKQSRSSFSIPSSRTPAHKEVIPAAMIDDTDFPEFDVVDRGVEFEAKNGKQEEEEEQSGKGSAASSEVVKEVVQDLSRMKELDSIAEQIKALESIMEENEFNNDEEETGSQKLDAEEDKVTREFLQMLDVPKDRKAATAICGSDDKLCKRKPGSKEEDEEEIYVPDLGKGLGCVVQTRNGGYLAAANPFETPVARKDKPKLAIQMSKPLVVRSDGAGFEMLQKMAGIGFEELISELSDSMPMDELIGKTAEQIAFEGIASGIIQGRKKEGATSSAARTIAAVKSMAAAMNSGRKARASTGILDVGAEAVTVEEILACTMHKMETMAVEALKIQADAAEFGMPFDVSPIPTANGKQLPNPLASAVPIEDWIKSNDANRSDAGGITVSVVVQLRDPVRQYEAVGGHMIVLIHATDEESKPGEENRYRVASVQVAGVKVKTLRSKNAWDGEKQKLTALQWLVANGMAKAGAGKKVKVHIPVGPDILWSVSSRAVAGMWLKAVRNPNVKFTK